MPSVAAAASSQAAGLAVLEAEGETGEEKVAPSQRQRPWPRPAGDEDDGFDPST